LLLKKAHEKESNQEEKEQKSKTNYGKTHKKFPKLNFSVILSLATNELKNEIVST